MLNGQAQQRLRRSRRRSWETGRGRRRGSWGRGRQRTEHASRRSRGVEGARVQLEAGARSGKTEAGPKRTRNFVFGKHIRCARNPPRDTTATPENARESRGDAAAGGQTSCRRRTGSRADGPRGDGDGPRGRAALRSQNRPRRAHRTPCPRGS